MRQTPSASLRSWCFCVCSAFCGVCAHWAEGSLITIDKDLDSAQIYRDLELGIANGGGNMPVFLGTLCEPPLSSVHWSE